MVSGRSDGPPASRRLTLPQSTSYDKSRKPHALRSGVDTKSVHFDWISKELECGICEKTIQNTMVVRVGIDIFELNAELFFAFLSAPKINSLSSLILKSSSFLL